MTIELNSKFSCKRDPHQWILTEKYQGLDKDKKPKEQERRTFHGSLQQVFSYVIDKECGECESLEELCNTIKETKEELIIALGRLNYR